MGVSIIPEAGTGADSHFLRSNRNQIEQDFGVLQSGMESSDLSEAMNAFSILQSLVSDDQSNRAQSLPSGDLASAPTIVAGLDSGSRQAVHSVVNQLLESATVKIRMFLKAERATIFLVDRENGQLLSHIAHGVNGESIDIRIPLTTGVAGRVVETREGMTVSDPYNHPDFNPAVDRSTGYITRSILCLPVFDQRQSVFAVVQLINKVGTEGFSELDKSALQNLAAPLGVILQICTRLRKHQ